MKPALLVALLLTKHIADPLPGAQLVPHAGRVLHFETPEIFNRELIKVLKSDGGASSQAGK